MTERSSSIRLALVQQAADRDPSANSKRAEEAVRAAAARGAELVCLPELFRTRYFPQVESADCFDLAEPVPGPTTERMAALAGELGIVLIVPLFERRAAGFNHNSDIIHDSDGSFAAYPTSLGRIGVLLCWDQWFPEAARLAALDGAQILLYPTANGWLDGEDSEENRAQQDSWLTVQRGHAIANGVFVAAANRVGREDALTFYGSSFVCDPQGRVLARASEHEEDLLVVDCDLARIEEQRRGWPFLRDRRIDAYTDLVTRYRR